jgi:hypothetical protein
MSEISSEVKTRQQPRLDAAGVPAGLVAISPTTMARRRRFVRVGFLLSILGGLGLSATPRPTYGDHEVKTATLDGVTTQVHEFNFRRDFGIPFTTVKTAIGDHGELKSVSADGAGMVGILGNMLAAAALVIGGSMLIQRRRRGD